MAFLAAIPAIIGALGTAAGAVGAAGTAAAVGGVAGAAASATLAGTIAGLLPAGLTAALPAIGTGLQVAGALGSVATGIMGGNQQARGYERAAQDQARQTDLAVTAERKSNARVLAKQEAVGAASGLQTTSGSMLEMNIDTYNTGELNAQMIKEQGYGKVRSLKNQAKQARSDGYLDAVSGGIKRSSTMMGSFLKA